MSPEFKSKNDLEAEGEILQGKFDIDSIFDKSNLVKLQGSEGKNT
jgi:hypothetical protein